MADKRCSHEDCEKFCLLGKDFCYEHLPGVEVEPEEEIPQRFLDRDPNSDNWPLVEAGAPGTGYFVECPYCACAVHSKSAKWHSKYHQSLNENMKAIYRGIENAAYSR